MERGYLINLLTSLFIFNNIQIREVIFKRNTPTQCQTEFECVIT